MKILESEIEKYIIEHTSVEPDLLKDLTRQTHLNVLRPRMLSGFVQGRILKMLVQMINPNRVLELGTFTGYSALCIAEGLNENAKIDTIENDEELEEMILSFFEKSDYKDKITLYIGDALKVIPTLNFSYDMVFIDANKRNYIEYYDAVFDKIPSGGYIIADNVLWDGHVLTPDSEIKSSDTQTLGIKRFNDYVMNDDRVENVLFPVRDGLMIVRKK